MNPQTIRPYFLIALLATSVCLVFFIFQPFLIVLLLAAIFAIILQPLYQMALHRMGSSPGIAALVTILFSVICILVPLLFISMQIANSAQQLYTSLSDGSGKAYLDTLFQSANEVVAQNAPSLAVSGDELSASVDQYLKNLLTWLVKSLGGTFSEIAHFLIDFFVFLIALYYLLRDGTKLRKTLIALSPLADTDDVAVFSRLELAVHSVIRGSLLVALIQGILTGIGFSIAGVPNGVLWGVVAVFTALIPGVGTSLVLIPGVAYLFVTGATTSAIGLLIWSVTAVGLIDNFLGPRLVGKGMQLHPLIVLLSVFGGLAFFGPSGIFLGPLCMSLLFALLSIYKQTATPATA